MVFGWWPFSPDFEPTPATDKLLKEVRQRVKPSTTSQSDQIKQLVRAGANRFGVRVAPIVR